MNAPATGAYVAPKDNVCPSCGEADYGEGSRSARLRCDLRLWMRRCVPGGGSGSWAVDGLRWWFLFGERLRIGIVDHRRLDRSLAAEGIWPWICGDGYRYAHVGPYCFRLRGRPTSDGPDSTPDGAA